jgi:DNA-binding NtrC family response regulator
MSPPEPPAVRPPAEGPTVGVLEDDPVMAQSLVQRLQLEGYATRHWACGADALREIGDTPLDLFICDIRLPDTTGADVFRSLARRGFQVPVILTTAYGDIDQAVGLMRDGAFDYVTKPFEMAAFLDKIAAAVDRAPGDDASPLLGWSPAMRRIEQLLRRVADIDSTVLITGESGVGKEVAARFLHLQSRRAGRPFVAVNCAAIPTELIESELFGHVRGAFTGATAAHRGYLERAGDGTLFLDEIGDLPLPVQAKLLRVLQERSFTAVGGERPLRFDARVVAATHADLAARAAGGGFREDLLFRINVIPVKMPPLRERPEDIEPLLRAFVREFAESMGRPFRLRVSPAAVEAAALHSWRGNVRELRNRVERAVALCDDGTLSAADMFPELVVGDQDAPGLTLEAVRERAERSHIRSVLRETGGRLQLAASRLGISRTTLWDRIRRLGIDADPTDD